MTGRICCAFQHIRYTVKAGEPRITDPQAGIHAVCIIKNPRKIHCVSAVDQNNYLAESTGIFLLFCKFQQIYFLLLQSKLTLCISCGIYHIVAFPAFSGKHDNGSISVFRKTVFQFIRIEGSRFFAN